MTRGELIKAARLKRNLTQAQLAEKCEMATITIRQYENGKRTPQAEQLAIIAMALDVSVADLWGDDDSNFLLNSKLSNFVVGARKAILAVENGNVNWFMLTKEKSDTQIDNIRDIALLMNELNEDGQRIAVERVEELTHISKYQHTSHEKPPVDAHLNTDTQE